ncbi:MAG: AAA family ATPase [Oscillospiraceae bacterium]|nr:AAA family ATPase [Oscillospiraceae bacterium]
MNITESELFPMNIQAMVDMLSEAYTALIRTEAPLRSFPSVMLWGPPGVGKSQGVRALADRIRENTGKECVVTDVRLLLFNPVDLRGIPTANEDKTLAVWLKPKIFQMDESADTVNILFLDEISAAPPSVQAAAYQITLDRTVGEHRLPENCIVIAAGNRITDKSVAYHMPKALANRLCHIEIKGDYDAWHRWAVRKDIHPFVTGYLEYNPVALLRFEPTAGSLAFPTPRSWEMVSNILNTVSEDVDKIYPMLVGCIGFAVANNFKTWTQIYRAMPSMEDIFLGDRAETPRSEELQIALRSVMVRYARRHPQEIKLDYSIDYACRLPWSFRVKLLRDYMQIPELIPMLKRNSVYQTAKENGQL